MGERENCTQGIHEVAQVVKIEQKLCNSESYLAEGLADGKHIWWMGKQISGDHRE